jgi:F-type H+-transporting ATPase subunit gamma
MQSLEALKRKTNSAEDLQSVVRTMKTLAAVSIRQYEAAVESLQDYFATVEDGIRMLLWNAPQGSEASRTLPASRTLTGAIVFGSDQGLCGQFNEQIVLYADESLSGDRETHRFLAVGVRAANGLRDRGRLVDVELNLPGSATGITALVQDLLRRVDEWRTERQLGRMLLFYNRRRTAATFRPLELQLLPVPDSLRKRTERKWPGRTLPAFTMDRSRLFSALIRQYLFTALFRACAESLAGENASRIASMQSAERNIGELLLDLRTQYNQQRQTGITEELLEVITGFEVLRDEELRHTRRK